MRPGAGDALLAAARYAARSAHAPYSRFRVGAALLGRSGRIYVGCNVENASYGLSLCAERAAVARAVAEGERGFEAIAVVGGAGGAEEGEREGDAEEDAGEDAGECLPCGACRQVLAEFCGDDLAVLTAGPGGAVVQRRLGDLLPEPFRLGPIPDAPAGAAGGAPAWRPRAQAPVPAAPPPAPPGAPAWRWVRATWAAIGDALAVLVGLAGAEARRAVAETWAPALVAGVAAAAAGALAGAAVAAPADNPLASTAAASALAAPAAIAVAAVLVWVRSAAAARSSAWGWHSLRVRGAALWQIGGLVALTALPRAGVAAGCGAAAAIAATLAVAIASFFARTTTSGAIFADALLWAAAAAALLSVAAAAAALGPALRPPAHFRSAGAGGPGLQRLLPDLVLIAAAAVLGLAARAFLASAPPAQVAAFASGLAAGGPGAAPGFWLLPAVDGAGAALLLGAALLAGRVLSACVGAVERWRGASLQPSWLLVLRAAARGTTRLRLVLLPAFTAGALAFCVAGALGVAATDRGLQAALAGADLRVDAAWASPCQAAPTSQAASIGISACCAEVEAPAAPAGASPADAATSAPDAGGTGSPAPAAIPPAPAATPASPGGPGTVCVPFTQVPLPPFAQVGSLASAGAPQTSLVLAPDLWSGPSGQESLEIVGIDPAQAQTALRWQDVPDAAAGRSALAALGQGSGGAVISAALAARTGLAPGDRFSTSLFADLQVLAVLPDWPGVGAGAGAWAVVPEALLVPAVQQSRVYALGGLQTELLIDRPIAAAPVEAALRRYGAAVTGLQRPRPGGWGLGWLPFALAPAAAGLLLLLLPALRAWDVDPAAFPQGEALFAVAAASEARAARRRFGALVGWFGAAWGIAAGTAAAALLWPAVRIQPGGAAGAGFQPSWSPLWAAALLAAAGIAALAGPAVFGRRAAPDPVVAERVRAAALRSPEPPPREAPRAPAAPARRRAALDRSRLPSAPILAFAMLAARRLGASWPRLLGLGAGILLAAAVAATVPLYTTGSLTRVLQQGLQPVNQRPPGALLVDYEPRQGASITEPQLQQMQALASGAGPSSGLSATPVVSYLATQPMEATPSAQVGQISAQSAYLSLDAVPDLAQHVTLERGVLPGSAPEAGGVLEAAATDLTMTENDLTLGTVYVLDTPGGGTLRVQIAGVFAESDPQGDFWPFAYFHQDLFIDYGELGGLLTQSDPLALNEASWYQVLNLQSLTVETVPAALKAMAALQVRLDEALPGATVDVSPFGNLTSFVQREQTLTALLRLVSVPILAMALYFVALTAGLIVDSEAGEISVYTSRGANAVHIILLYVLEWVLLAVPLAAAAPFPAALFARAMGAASGFLHFVPRPPLAIFLERRDFVYSAAAAGLAVAAALLPTIGAMGRSVVAARLRTSRTVDQPLWQRAYLDGLALLALAVAWRVFRGVSLGTGGASAIVADPALYLLPAIFLAVSGLLAVRFLGWLMRSLDAGAGPWLQAAAVLPLRRIGRLPAQFAPVLLLLCFTAALGTYSAAAARTLDGNLVAAVRYAVGAPLRLVEDSPCTQMQDIAGTVCATADDVMPVLPSGASRPLPAFGYNLQAKGVADATEIDVLQANFTGGGLLQVPAALILVDPASFERVAWWDQAWDPLPETRYLELLQSQPGAMLVSPDVARLTHASTLQVGLQGGQGAGASFSVVGTVGYWPGAGAADPMLVASASSGASLLDLDCGTDPCITSRIALIRTKAGAAPAAIAGELTADGIAVTQQDVASTEEAAALATPEWAGQSGLLTIGFLVALAVTIVGYLLYASLVLRGQLSQLGLLRALGLDWRAVVGAVALEQGILVIAGALAGALSGMVASALFLPLFRPAFTGPSSPPFSASGPGSALWEVAAVLVLLFGAVLASLLALLRRMHVGETVKLEE